jgi:hypothetical protein
LSVEIGEVFPKRETPVHRSRHLAVLLCALAPAIVVGAAPEGAPPPTEQAAAAPGAEEAAKAPAAALPADRAAAPAASAPAPAAAPVQVEVVAPAERGRPVEEQVDLRVRTLQERVNELKEKIFRTKARLLTLQEMVIGGDITAGAKAVILHRNEMGASFVLEAATYSLDGAPVFTKVDQEGSLDRREEIEVFAGRLAPGNHQLSVKLTYRGHGYGVFSYLEGWRFKVQSSCTFDAGAGNVTTVKVVGYEKGGLGADPRDRPGLKYVVDAKKEEPRKPAAQAAAGAAR